MNECALSHDLSNCSAHAVTHSLHTKTMTAGLTASISLRMTPLQHIAKHLLLLAYMVQTAAIWYIYGYIMVPA